MKNFQKNPDLTEQEVKVRLFAMMSTGSILGDGSDFRNKIAADRAKMCLDNKNVCAFFSDPKAFTPLKFADGASFDQQLAFYLPGTEVLFSQFNFDNKKEFKESWSRKDIGLSNGEYVIKDFLSGQTIGKIDKNQDSFTINVPAGDAKMIRLVHVN
jgi:alpha-galactosidase